MDPIGFLDALALLPRVVQDIGRFYALSLDGQYDCRNLLGVAQWPSPGLGADGAALLGCHIIHPGGVGAAGGRPSACDSRGIISWCIRYKFIFAYLG